MAVCLAIRGVFADSMRDHIVLHKDLSEPHKMIRHVDDCFSVQLRAEAKKIEDEIATMDLRADELPGSFIARIHVKVDLIQSIRPSFGIDDYHRLLAPVIARCGWNHLMERNYPPMLVHDRRLTSRVPKAMRLVEIALKFADKPIQQAARPAARPATSVTATGGSSFASLRCAFCEEIGHKERHCPIRPPGVRGRYSDRRRSLRQDGNGNGNGFGNQARNMDYGGVGREVAGRGDAGGNGGQMQGAARLDANVRQ
ncbi:hypothetical protein BCR44DRAFT_1423899 [Catenaria anguillulae PL171]|uniref:CCHC-type domain-containing protein n=1 Tax=Catenaria anguillulae PL171 TaxID=765915 RepID=A0A1Y2H6B7_9FUNG|nr:hypothetical protein BCR44DRAFT_1453142 [Catenaria anguillulae PL171]ORZ40845.1 hypothetical protein BCR44DRAFT_1423899 [Catenaria anguillulae PL171]